jgi:Xaa-Pro aminopeptidase
MRADLDRLMADRNLTALLVLGGHDNPPRDYLTGGAQITGGLVIKPRGADPVLIVSGMEVEEAAASGLTVYHDGDWRLLFRQANGRSESVDAALWARCFAALGITPGTIGVYGVGDINLYLELVRQLEAGLPEYRFNGEIGRTIFDEAAATKDAGELARLRAVAERTAVVLRQTRDFIAGHRAAGDYVVDAAGERLTVGVVRRFVRRALLDHGLEDTGMIFAQGRDGAFPHSRGTDSDPLRTGEAIVFDLFPREMGGGYHHDVTRTWCIGHAPPAVEATYQQVIAALELAVATFEEPGQPAHTLQDAVLDYFEGLGHPTTRSDPDSLKGYVHSLGHGIGLNIHESPYLSHQMREETLPTGSVITIEPGLYDPDAGFGVRVEDTFIIDETGALVSITDFPRDLVIPLRG